MNSLLIELGHWTPSFATGFSINLLISLVSMCAGTAIGWVIAKGRLSSQQTLLLSSNMLTAVFRNIPSFVFMFYIAFILPVEFQWLGQDYRLSPWIKAAIALTVPVVGFTSDQFYRLYKENQNNPIALPMFFVSWTQYFLIILMASSTASVIGVDEIVGRANTAIAVTRDPNIMLWVYLYVSLWFLLSATIINGVLKYVSQYLKAQYAGQAVSAN